MANAQLYFLSDNYYMDFPDNKLMRNKEMIDGRTSNRPCFFAFSDNKNPEISWLVPISSKIEKYKYEQQKKINTYGRCNTIRFGLVFGREAAFLIQNMFPVTGKYISPYIDKNNQPVRIDDRIIADVVKNAREVLGIANMGAKIIFPDIKTIYAALTDQLEQQKNDVPSPEVTSQTSIRQDTAADPGQSQATTADLGKPQAAAVDPGQPRVNMKNRLAMAQTEADQRNGSHDSQKIDHEKSCSKEEI